MSFVQSPSLLYVSSFVSLLLDRSCERSCAASCRLLIVERRSRLFFPFSPRSRKISPSSDQSNLRANDKCSLYTRCTYNNIYIYIRNVNKQIGNTNKQTGIVNKQRRGGECKQTNLNRTNKSDFQRYYPIPPLYSRYY